MSGRREGGATGLLIVLVLVLTMGGYLATSVLARVATSRGDLRETSRRMARATGAIDQFAASAARLPCPADPAATTGLESPVVPTGTCTFGDGTLPWATLGLKSDDAFDTWGRKLSYRVYAGSGGGGNGSLTRPNGINMVDCAINGSAGKDSNGLCLPADPNPANRTNDATFLAGKGLTLTDFGTTYNDVAYVVLSCGPTGAGGYTVSGAQLDLPVGDQRNNLRDTGPFTIRAFSDPDVEPTTGQHFDDLLAYRRLPDLVRRANLVARTW